ncbi:putative protease YdcP [bioreactor metagenome]|uniref:Putative protease YdcP n=1 Tax=bioreactor metagenome TaxID=1076179 RepID=A0A644WXG7_9ZZZZ
MNPTLIELLSPARDAEHGIAAINTGADAVYIGAPKFGARSAAGNSIAEIEKLCIHAHRFHAKVYAALNTILFDDELAEAERMIHAIYNAGADALIVQDMGILEMDLPPIQLHASTQAHNFDVRRIKFLQDIGFSRAIIARELSLEQIREIKSQISFGLEAFVHGALCVSFSGQCYMSAFHGHRSGNRGECAQPCRLNYDIMGQNNRIVDSGVNALSIRDMNRSAHLAEMIAAGVTSFKIEGRLKDMNYVRNITSYYRRKLDEIIDANEKLGRVALGRCTPDFEPDPEKSFNRGFTEYFLHGRTEKISAHTSKSLGKRLGQVSESGWNFIKIAGAPEISNGDGLCWFDQNGALKGFAVQTTDHGKIYSDNAIDVTQGTVIYRNLDTVFNHRIAAAGPARRIPVNIVFSETESGVDLNISTEDGKYSLIRNFQTEKNIARDAVKAADTIKTQLCKTGSTFYDVVGFELKWGSPLFFPIGELNRIRREAFEAFDQLLNSEYHREENTVVVNDVPYFENEAGFALNVSNALAEQFYKRHGVVKISPAFELADDNRGKNLMTTKLCLRYEYNCCPVFQKADADREPQFLILGNNKFRLDYDCKSCVMKISDAGSYD